MIGVVADVDVEGARAISWRASFDALTGEKSPKVGEPRWPKSVKIAAEAARQGADRDRARFSRRRRARDDARFAAAMIASVASGLGGRFFDELRDKQSLGVHRAGVR